MSTFVRLLEAAALLKPVAQGVAVRNAFPKAIKLAAIGMATIVIAAAVIVFGLYGVNVELALHGFDPEQALLISFCGACIVLILFVLWLLETVAEFKRALLPKPTGVLGVVDAFLHGLKAADIVQPGKKK